MLPLKKYLLFGISSIVSLSAFSQTSGFKGDELYATVNSLRDFDFGFAYKRNLSGNWYLRFDVLNASFSNKTQENATIVVDPEGETIDVTKIKNANYGLGIGIERRTDFNTHIEFLYGLSLLGSYLDNMTEGSSPDHLSLTNISQTSWSYGAGLNVGVLIKLAQNLYVSGELLPKYMIIKENTTYLTQPSNTSRTQDSSGSSFNFDFKDIRLSLVYRFRR